MWIISSIAITSMGTSASYYFYQKRCFKRKKKRNISGSSSTSSRIHNNNNNNNNNSTNSNPVLVLPAGSSSRHPSSTSQQQEVRIRNRRTTATAIRNNISGGNSSSSSSSRSSSSSSTTSTSFRSCCCSDDDDGSITSNHHTINNNNNNNNDTILQSTTTTTTTLHQHHDVPPSVVVATPSSSCQNSIIRCTNHPEKNDFCATITAATTTDPNKHTNSNYTNDCKLIQLAEQAYQDEKLLVAHRFLRQVIHKDVLFTRFHYDIIEKATKCHTMVADIINNNNNTNSTNDDVDDENENNDWIKQGECHGEYNTFVYYKEPKDTTSILCRVETPIESTLLIPLLSVLNESNLYSSWVPSFPKLRLGIKVSKQLVSTSRVNQIIYFYGNSPWPFTPRQLVLQTTAIDESENGIHTPPPPTTTTTTTTTNSSSISSSNMNNDDPMNSHHDNTTTTNNDNSIDTNTNHNNYYLAVILQNMNEADMMKHDIQTKIPKDDNSAVLCDFQGTFVFRPCPFDHPTLKEQKETHPTSSTTTTTTTTTTTDNNNNNNNSNQQHVEDDAGNKNGKNKKKEPMILVSFKMLLDPHMKGVPTSIVNFILRQGIGSIWGMLLHVAKEVQNGKRPLHTEAIHSKPEIYNFIQQRANYMIERLQQEQQQQQVQQQQQQQQEYEQNEKQKEIIITNQQRDPCLIEKDDIDAAFYYLT